MSTEHHAPKAGVVQLTFMIFGASCGGAFGAEELVSTAGPGVALFTLALIPFIFSIPIAFAVAELTAAYPLEGGNYRWSRMAFGDFWGFQAAWWMWMTGVAMNSLYAVLFADYLHGWFPAIQGLNHWLVCLGLIWFLHCLNMRGIEVVGESAIVLSVVLLIPFILMSAIGFAGWNHNPLVPFVAPGKDFVSAFGGALALGIFLYSGYDRLSTVAEEVENPQKTFPKALGIAVTMALLCYVVPTMAGLAARGEWESWGRAYFPIVAGKIGGDWLGHAMTLGGLASTALLLNVTILSASRIPYTLAEDGFLPAILTKTHPVHETPTHSLFWGSLTYSVLALADMNTLLIVNAWFQMGSNILVYANVWKLRSVDTRMQTTFSIPGRGVGLVICTVPTVALALMAMATTAFDNGSFSARQLGIGLASLASGPALFWMARAWMRRAGGKS